MPGLAGAISSLGLLALPAIASPAYFEPQPVTDTWSLSITDSATVDATTPPTAKAGSDTWSLSLTESDSALTTYPAQVSQLSLLAVPGGWVEIGAKAYTSLNPVVGSDTWLLAWLEDPTSDRTLDTWDIWRLTWSDATPSLTISQTFSAGDVWSLGWLDVASVFAGGPLFKTPVDTWSLSIVDAAVVAATAGDTDTWTLSITDAATIVVTQDAIAAGDTWSLTYSLEAATVGTVVNIPILASDEWRLTLAEAVTISKHTSAVSAVRIVRVPRRTHIVRVK